jgi:hypothetical protein
MNEDQLKEELTHAGFVIEKILARLVNCHKIIAERNGQTVFIKCFNLRQIFKSNVYKKWVNHEIKVGESLHSKSINTAVVLEEKIYTENYLILVYEYCRHRTLE